MKANLTAKISQKTGISQAVQQNLQILQMSALEMEDFIKEEIADNPLLDDNLLYESDNNGISEDIRKQISHESTRADEYEINQLTNSDTGDSEFDEEEYLSKKSNESNLVSRESLIDILTGQIKTAGLPEDDELLIVNMIHLLDDNGLFMQDLSDIAVLTGVTTDKVRELCDYLKNLEPFGCGSFSVKECLIFQSGKLFPDDKIVINILSNYFDQIMNLKFEEITNGLKISIDDVISAGKKIHDLNPYPGNEFSTKKTQYIKEDFFVDVVDNEIVITEYTPRYYKLSVNNYYLEMLNKKNIDKKLTKYIKDKLQRASDLMKCLKFRKSTIVSVLEKVFDSQKNFLLYGAGNLKPLTYNDIAVKIDMSESTVCRAVTGKYVRTKWGVYEIKYFFSGKMQSDTNFEEHSSDEVMKLIRDIVMNENSDNPETDEDICAKINKLGINAARRTVAKYRGIMNIPSSSKRKKITKLKLESEK